MKAVVWHGIGDIRMGSSASIRHRPRVPIGMAMNKNRTLRMGNCNHRRYHDVLIEHVRSGRLDPVTILTKVEPLTGVIAAYEAFDRREPGWIKVELEPAG